VAREGNRDRAAGEIIMSAAALIMMVLMLGVYFGGFVYFALRKEPRKPASRKPAQPPPGPIITP
jgi:hypothetical protein